MSGSEPIETIQQAIRRAVARGNDELREEILSLLREQTGALERAVAQFSPSEPTSYLSEEELTPLVQVAAPVDNTALLRQAATAIDQATDQREILQALVSAGAHFAQRSALFLTRKNEVQGWAMHGFDSGAPNIEDIRVEYAVGSPWKRLLQEGGVISLSTGECAPLVSRLESALPREALLVPLIVGDRIAAALYVDRLDDSHPIATEALEVLTYLTALAIETLPFRSRRTTPTLYQAGDIEMSELLAPWDPEESAAPVEAEAAGAPVEASAPAGIETPAEGAPEKTPALEASPPAAEPATETIEAEAAQLSSVPAAEPEAGAQEQEEESASDYGFAESSEAGADTDIQSQTSETLQVDLSEDETVLLDRPITPAPPAEPPRTPPAEQAPEPQKPESAPAPDEEETRPGRLGGHPETTGSPAAPLIESAEVAPPADVFGPGLAFSSGEGESALHDEARRLARLLVSEIKLYNEEEVRRGREQRDLYERLQSDIERSREIYEERIDPALRHKTEYFDQELVRLLAGGDRSAMGGEFEQSGD
ncbi:MAG TPA: hypothetical protein VKA53_10910 [Thermoanaerobaculia bacterium]|nr:hypothetical protein [Thermoanaerobaculia bacterium]